LQALTFPDFRTYRLLPQFYKRVQWSIDQVKHRRPKLPRSDSICSASSSLQSVIKCKQMLTAHSLTASPQTYQEIVAQIKQESFSALEVAAPAPVEEAAHQPRSSVASSASSCSLKAKPPKKTCTKADLYVYNPITNYVGYNRHVDSQRSVDEDNQNNDPWVRQMFAQFGLRVCQTRVHDVMRTDFTGMTVPIRLTHAMKLKYRLCTEPAAPASKRPPQKTRRKTIGGRGGLQRRGRRAKSPVVTAERDSSSTEEVLFLLNDDDSNSTGLPDLDLHVAPSEVAATGPALQLNIASIFTNLKKKNTPIGKDKENIVVLEDTDDSELDLDNRPAKRTKLSRSSQNEGEPLAKTPTLVKFLEMKKKAGQTPPPQEAGLKTPSSGNTLRPRAPTNTPRTDPTDVCFRRLQAPGQNALLQPEEALGQKGFAQDLSRAARPSKGLLHQGCRPQADLRGRRDSRGQRGQTSYAKDDAEKATPGLSR